MDMLSDDELIAELKKRFDQTKQALYDVKMISKKLEDVNHKLQLSEQVKSNFVSHMKNEINNPLSCILGLSQQLVSASSDPAMVTNAAALIYNEAFSLDFQLRNIFAAAELESGETTLQVSMVDINTLILSTIESFQHLIQDKRLTIEFTPQGDERNRLLFKTDAERLRLVFTNLLSNAIEFNREEGLITIQAAQLDDLLTLTVSDTGVGIDMSQLHRLFDRFVQGESGMRKSHKGHGLGLSITQAVLDLMQGTVSVNSQEGSGATFTISVPELPSDAEADAFSVDGNEFLFGDDDGAEAF
ncbi:MAG: HAMP domain-containing histidine kinase [Magnetococcales bacterium]|nr:HAMP domain-containing histidine kinase [Magnetococcales bacterium]NGZ04888.1 HAMP domain-containing histidine kinase [Magnetococcales bacterium]